MALSQVTRTDPAGVTAPAGRQGLSRGSKSGPGLLWGRLSGYVSTTREYACGACGATIPTRKPYLVAGGSTFCYACQGAALEAGGTCQ